MRRERLNPPKSLRATQIVDDVVNKNRPFAAGEKEEIVGLGKYAEAAAVRLMRSRVGQFAADGLKKALSSVRKGLGEGSGVMGPPDVRKLSERTMISKRKPGEWGGAGR